MKVYLAAAFRRHSRRSSQDKAYGEIGDPEYVKHLEAIEDVFLDYGFDTCLPHRDEGMWGKVYYDPAAISALCLRHVATSDAIFAIAEGGRGVHIEMGYAAGLGGKRMFLARNVDEEESTLIHGFSEISSPWKRIKRGICDASLITYTDSKDLIKKLRANIEVAYGTKARTVNVAPRTNVALIDLGSHTIKFKVHSYRQGSQPRLLYAEKNSLGIMGEVTQTGTLSKFALNAIMSLLDGWRSTANEFDCRSFMVTGTAALRKAKNANELAERIRSTFGWELRIISPKEELKAIYDGVRNRFPGETQIAVLNLGGGSIQVAVGSARETASEFYLDFGTRHIIEKWPWIKPFDKAGYNELLKYVRRIVQKNIESLSISPPECMIHTGGELDFMLKCRLPMALSRFSPSHVSEVSLSSFSEFSRQFAKMTPATVSREFNLDPAWALGSVASNAIAQTVAETLKIETIVPSNCNIIDGLLASGVGND